MIRLRRMIKNEKGFTLIELLVVIAILGIIAGLAVPRVVDAVSKAKQNSETANKKTLEGALERYFVDFDKYPADLNTLVTEKYIKEVPKKADSSDFTYTPSSPKTVGGTDYQAFTLN